MTAGEYQTTADGPPWFELIEGQLLQEPSPTSGHQSIQGELFFALRSYLEQHPIGRVFPAPLDVYLDELNVFQPDLLLVLNERRSMIAEKGIVGAPDLVVEILSPSNRMTDLGSKRIIYGRSGVTRLWIVDPLIGSLTDYDLTAQVDVPCRVWDRADLTEVSCPLLPGFALRWSRVFA